MNESDWHAWRSQGIGSSDAPIVAGVSPYMTPFELWEHKTGRKKAWMGNWATRRGTALEPIARAHYSLLMNRDMPAALIRNRYFPMLQSSLDGWDAENRVILEIKCPGRVDHQLAREGKIPPKYVPQLQHQLFVAGAERVDYFSFDGDAGIIVPVYFDEEWFKGYFSKALDFWKCVESDTPPPMVERDWKLVRDKRLRLALEEMWEETRGDLRTADRSQQIISDFNLKDRRSRCSGFLIDGYTNTITTTDSLRQNPQ